MLDTLVKEQVSYYHVTTFLLSVLLVILLRRIYINYMKPYTEFPTFPLIFHIMNCTVTKKIPKNLPFTSFFFQEFVRIAKLFQKEGVVLFWLPEPVLAIFDEDVVKAFSNDQAVLDKAYKYYLLRDITGNGLVASNGVTWKTHRKLLNPVFHVGVLKKKLPMFNESAKILVKYLEKSVHGSSIDVLELLKSCALGNLCEFALGLKLNNPDNKEIIKDYAEEVKTVSEFTVSRLAYPWLHFKFMLKFTSSGRKFEKMIERLHNFTREIISAMRESMESLQADRTIEDDWNEDEARKSFAHILLNHHLKDNTFTMEDVQNQVITFMAAGHDSVSYTLQWILFLLGHHPEVQYEVCNEVDALGGRNIIYEDLHQLKYLECVIKETLRLYPTVPVYGRTLNKEMHCGKYKVPKGTDILFFPYLLHRDPEVFPDPEKFDPSRFMADSSTRRPGNYVPFSEGIRHCIGKRFAMMEMKVIIVYILRNFRVESLDRWEDVDLSWNIVLAPVRPLLFRFTPRM